MDFPAPSSARSFKKATRASLELLKTTADAMSLSQLSATRHRLSETLKFFEAKVDERTKATLAENQKVMIDLRDWGDSDSDSDDETTTAGEPMEFQNDAEEPLPIPGPYPITPPEGKEAADAYYVVDYGREVGIFDDELIAIHAIAGIANGHLTKLDAWRDAATFYNMLWEQDLVIQVQD